jgi:porphobilinogen synthase
MIEQLQAPTLTAVTPGRRARRLRRTEAIRRLVRETRLSPASFVYPMFVAEGLEGRREIPSMPGQAQHGLNSLVETAGQVVRAGIPAVLVFGLPSLKDASGSQAWASEGVVQRAFKALKDAYAERLLVIADLCMCEYTDHGHCGLLSGSEVDNDATVQLYQRIAVSQAEAGADVIAPSGMMDGQVAAIRSALDESGFPATPILAYAAKHASGFYGPFREAAGSTPQFGDRRGYQMDPANGREAMVEMEVDLEEGADLLMVKPALAYLDLIAEARARFDVPIAAYNVSAEYSMVKAAALNGWIDEKRITLEILTAIARAGAHVLITYHALEAAKWLAEEAG